MIYIILDVVIENDDITNIQSRPIIKIGFTNNWKLRRSSYINHGPGIKILRTIKGGTELQERALHQKFKHLKYKGYGNEWFEYDKDMIDYLMSVTLSDLEELVLSSPIVKLTSEIRKYLDISYDVCLKHLLGLNNFERDNITDETLKLKYDKVNDAYEVYSNLEYARSTVRNDFNLLTKDMIHKIFDIEQTSNLHEEIKFRLSMDYSIYEVGVRNFLDEFDKDGNFSRRMKLLCESYNSFTKEELMLIFRVIPLEYHKHYYTLGPEKLKALGHVSTYVKREYEKRNFKKREDNVNLLDELFYNEFKEGDRISSADLKKRIKSIYENANCPNTPRAIDIKDYFETKEAKLTIDGKRCAAFDLIKKLR